MQTKTLQTKVTQRFFRNLKRDSIKPTDDYVILKLTEELGEFVQSYVVHKRQCRPAKYLSARESKKEMTKELSDVLGMVFVVAKQLNIDVEQGFVKKWITGEWIRPS